MGIRDLPGYLQSTIPSSREVYVYLMTFLAFLVPGSGYLFYFHNATFVNLAYPQLILAAIFISTPLYLIALIITAIEQGEEIRNEKEKELAILVSTSTKTLILFFLVLGYWLINKEKEKFVLFLYQVFLAYLTWELLKYIWKTWQKEGWKKVFKIKKLTSVLNYGGPPPKPSTTNPLPSNQFIGETIEENE